jgi:hypothetical protein
MTKFGLDPLSTDRDKENANKQIEKLNDERVKILSGCSMETRFLHNKDRIDAMLRDGWKITEINETIGYPQGYVIFEAPEGSELSQNTWKLKLDKKELIDFKNKYKESLSD